MRTTRDRGAGLWLAALLALPLMAACGDDDDMTGPSQGVIRVIVDTTGESAIPNYVIRLDGATEEAIEADGSIVFTEIGVGEHQVLLLSVPSNCAVSGGNPRTVTVVADQVAQVDFTVTCQGDDDPKPDPGPGEPE